ncbi:hypothetical protein BH09MYX1_BH09MYX1_08810 [soil metagenome]
MRIEAIVALATALSLTACSSDPVDPRVDAGFDASLDASRVDAKADAPMDGPREGAVDAGDASDAGTSDASDASEDGASDDASAPDAAVACDAKLLGQCGPGEFCDALSCGIGTCKAAVAETNALAPVCGCDKVTYWNDSVAQNRGVTAETKGECSIGAFCGGFLNVKCPGSTKCNRKQLSQTDCNISDPGGVCWGLPLQCPVSSGTKTHQCGGACKDQCALISIGFTYYDDSTCP